MTSKKIFMLALLTVLGAGGSAYAQQNVNLEELELVSEAKVSHEEFMGTLYDGDVRPSKGNYPDQLRDGNYPNQLRDANYPDQLRDGNYPDQLRDANYPDQLRGANYIPGEFEIQQMPAPKVRK